MKKEIVTCLTNKHPLYDDSFKRERIKIGRAYKCVDELVLTSKDYYKPEFSSLQGITIRSRVDKWGWSKPCLPKECFRLSTKVEISQYKTSLLLNAPIRFLKVWFFKIVRKTDYLVRRNYYKKLHDDFY